MANGWDINLYANVLTVARHYRDHDASVGDFLNSFSAPTQLLQEILEDAQMLRTREVEVLDERWNSSYEEILDWSDND